MRVTGELKTVFFPGPAGQLEGLWKEASGLRRGAAVLGHPHPLHGGTLHNKVVFRAAQALTEAGYGTLRFNFRGVGLSGGRHDAGRGETEDFHAALDEAERRGGLPIVAGGFSFGSAVALSAIDEDPRVSAFIGLGLPLASESGVSLPRPQVPALLVTGARDSIAPAGPLERFAGDSAELIVIPGADHFFDGKLSELEQVISRFLTALPVAAQP